MSKDSEIKTVT